MEGSNLTSAKLLETNLAGTVLIGSNLSNTYLSQIHYRGIGSKLIELTKIKARKEGYYSMCLLVFKDNSNAQNVYKKMDLK